MVIIRPSAARGHTQLDWLDSRHTFSFGEYYDPRHMGFRALRVINEDVVAPARGFGKHPHSDMEILTYVVGGALEHADSLGTGSVIRPGDVQRMSAGTGVTHSEVNPSSGEPVHLLQIWVVPERRNLPPSYEQKAFTDGDLRDCLRVVASRDGRDGSVTVHQDVALYATRLSQGRSVEHVLTRGRGAWLQVVRGALTLENTALRAGDGAAVEEESRLRLVADDDAEALLFDLG